MYCLFSCFHVHARFDFSIHNFDCSDIMTDAAPPPYPGNPTKGPGKVISLGFFVIISFTDPCILDNTLDNWGKKCTCLAFSETREKKTYQTEITWKYILRGKIKRLNNYMVETIVRVCI